MTEIIPRHYLFAFIAFTVIILGGINLLSIAAENDDDFFTANESADFEVFNRTFNQYSKLETEVTDLKGEIGDPSSGSLVEKFGVFNSLIQTSWNALKLLFTSFDFITGLILAAPVFFPGLPAWVGVLAVLAVTIMITFAILSVIFQREI